jgi:hypothetical protein
MGFGGDQKDTAASRFPQEHLSLVQAPNQSCTAVGQIPALNVMIPTHGPSQEGCIARHAMRRRLGHKNHRIRNILIVV